MDNIIFDKFKAEIDPMNAVSKKTAHYIMELEKQNKILRGLVDGFICKDDSFIKRFKKFCKMHKQIKAGRIT